jgi:hypothetical protein
MTVESKKKSRSKDATDGVLWVEVVCQVPRRPRLRSSVAVLGAGGWSSERSGGARVLDRQDTGKVALLSSRHPAPGGPTIVGEAGGACRFRAIFLFVQSGQSRSLPCPGTQCEAESGKSPTWRRCGKPAGRPGQTRGSRPRLGQCSRRAHTGPSLREWRGRATRPGRVWGGTWDTSAGCPSRTVPIVPRSAT